MQYIDRTIRPQSFCIAYEKEGVVTHLILTVGPTLDLLYRTDIIQGQTPGDTFEEALCVVAFVSRPQGPEEESLQQTYRVAADQILRDISDAECMRMVYHHEMMREYQKKGYRTLLNECRMEMRNIEKQLEENRRKMNTLTSILTT